MMRVAIQLATLDMRHEHFLCNPDQLFNTLKLPSSLKVSSEFCKFAKPYAGWSCGKKI
jgi:hypothetical protein